MKAIQSIFVGTAGALLALAAVTPAQEGLRLPTETPRPRPLAPATEPAELPRDAEEDAALVRPFADPGSGAAGAGRDADLEYELRERLALRDLDAREDAFDEAARRAAREPGVRAALHRIASDAADPDAAFVARLALREADRLASWGRAGSGFGGQGLPSRPDDPFDAMRQRLESMFGSDPFVDEFFSGDPFFSRPFRGRGPLLRRDPFFSGDPFEDLQRRVDEMRRNMEEALGDPGAAPNAGSSSSSSVRIESTPDGVRVEVVEDDGSGPRREVYEAESIEALLRLHPELKGRVGR
ncbi:MAG: hypothetical protein AAGB93_00910 [Planctomycetota bacterium]